jgi:hypothetical protein
MRGQLPSVLTLIVTASRIGEKDADREVKQIKPSESGAATKVVLRGPAGTKLLQVALEFPV